MSKFNELIEMFFEWGNTVKSFTASRCWKSGVRALVCVLLIFFAALTGRAQDTTATLTGNVKDTAGAIIPGAKLTLVNAATKAETDVTANGEGEYQFPNLTPGRYNLTVSMSGFQTQSQQNISLDAAQKARINLALTAGEVSQTVEVQAELPLLNYSDPTLSGTIAPETLINFPLVVSGAPRSSVSVATMLPGVTTGGGNNAFNARFNGGLVTGDEAIVDGATVLEGYMNQSGMVSLQTDFGMSPDITSEVTVLTANYPAQYGNSTSAQLIISTRSGGDSYHGAAYEYLRNEALNAFQYGVNAANTRKPQDRQNDFGGNLGGRIPFLRTTNFLKSYFYFNYEGFKQNGGASSSTISIPSLAARNGDFSGITTQLYYPNDPGKYGADAGAPIAFNGARNVINPAYADPIAKAWMAALPTPTSAGEFNNYYIPRAGQGSLTANENVYFGRLDFTLGEKDHVYYTSWWQFSGANLQTNLPEAISTASPADPENANIQRLNWEHTFSPTLTNHATLGYLNRNEGYFSLNGSSNLPTVQGVANTDYKPEFTFDTYTQLGNNTAPNSRDTKTTRGTWAFNDVLTKVLGAHTLRVGFEYRLAGTSIHLANNQGGTFAFANSTTGNSTCADSSCPGNAAASFFLGAASNANVNFYNVKAVYPRQYAFAAHLGDSWRVNPKLTLDYSLRWDVIFPFKEKFNHLSFFDPNGTNPGAVTASGAELKGRLAFAGSSYGASSYGAAYPEQVQYKNFAPRVGFAYTLDQNTVIRAGYGIYFGQAFYPGWSGGMSQDGFNKQFSVSQNASGVNQAPALYLNTGVNQAAVGPTQNISSAFDNGQAPSLYRPLDGNNRPYSSQYNLTVERQLPQRFALAVSYVGTKGTHLPSAVDPLNVLNPYNTSISGIGADLGVSYLSANGPATFAKYGVAVPYVGWANQMTGCAPTIGQALLPFPQYCGNLQGLNEQHGSSVYQSVQGKLERRFTKGLYLLGTLTYSKLMTDASNSTQSTSNTGAGNQGNNGSFSPFDISHRRYALAPDNVPIVSQISAVYELPFGHGKPFAGNTNGFVDRLIGGFQVSPLYRYEFGTPMSFYSSSCSTATESNGYFREQCVPAVIGSAYNQSRNSFNPTRGLFLNRSAFQTDFSSFGFTGTGSAVSKIYGPSYKNWDISVAKNTVITEHVNLKLFVNMFNAFNNHAYLASQGSATGGPSTAFVTDVSAQPSSTDPRSNFGAWNGNVTAARTVQLAGRIEF